MTIRSGWLIGVAIALGLAACGGSDESSDESVGTAAETSPESTEAVGTTVGTTADTAALSGSTDDGVLAVPDEFSTITEAVDAASPGDLVLISPGVYHEAVNVTTDEITIRGLDRNTVILDGEFELDNGIRVLGASGVVVENMTAQNYTNNGFFWTGVTGYRGSYLTAYRNGDYGVYVFDSVNGLLEHSYASGSPDAGFYIGQCFTCDAVIDDVTAEYNGLGYSGTNSGGELYLINSTFRFNRAGIVPNSGSYELCYPERSTTIVGNLVYSNNQTDTPAIDVAILAMGNGILPAGGVDNVIERNLVFDHDKTGIGLVPFLEEDPNDDLPTPDEWEVGCAEQRDQPPADVIPESLLWEPLNNQVLGNDVSDSRIADLGVAGVGTDTSALGNCFSGNTYATSRPANIETLAPCGSTGTGDWTIDTLDVLSWLEDIDTAPPSVDYATAPTPAPPVLGGMADPANAPSVPAADMPPKVDITAIAVPLRPEN